MTSMTSHPSVRTDPMEVFRGRMSDLTRQIAAMTQTQEREAKEQASRVWAELVPELATELADYEAAQGALRQAEQALTALRQPPQPAGDVRERALQRLYHEEATSEAGAALQKAQDAAQAAHGQLTAAARQVWRREHASALAAYEQWKAALHAKIAATWRELEALQAQAATQPAEYQRLQSLRAGAAQLGLGPADYLTPGERG